MGLLMDPLFIIMGVSWILAGRASYLDKSWRKISKPLAIVYAFLVAGGLAHRVDSRGLDSIGPAYLFGYLSLYALMVFGIGFIVAGLVRLRVQRNRQAIKHLNL